MHNSKDMDLQPPLSQGVEIAPTLMYLDQHIGYDV